MDAVKRDHRAIEKSHAECAAEVQRLTGAIVAARPQLQAIRDEHSAKLGFVFDFSCDLCALGWVLDVTLEMW